MHGERSVGEIHVPFRTKTIITQKRAPAQSRYAFLFLVAYECGYSARLFFNQSTPPVMKGERISQSAAIAMMV